MKNKKKTYRALFMGAFVISSLFVGYYRIYNKREKEEPVQKASITTPVNIPKAEQRYIPPAIPEILTGDEQELEYLILHYWDDFPMADTTCIGNKAFTEQALADYLYLLQQVSSPTGDKGLSNLLKRAMNESKFVFKHFMGLLEHYLYDPNSPMRDEERYKHILHHITVSSQLNDADKARWMYQLALIAKNNPGSIAQDFKYVLRSCSKGKLHSFKADYTLLIFFNPDCESCQQTIGDMEQSEWLARALEVKKLEVLAIYADAEEDIWKKHKEELPGSWKVGYNYSHSVINGGLYDLKAMPTLYLLDKNKRVMFKDKSWKEIERYISIHLTSVSACKAHYK